jgi:hypothetical protein
VDAVSAVTCRVTAPRDPWHAWFLTEIRNRTKAVTLPVRDFDNMKIILLFQSFNINT